MDFRVRIKSEQLYSFIGRGLNPNSLGARANNNLSIPSSIMGQPRLYSSRNLRALTNVTKNLQRHSELLMTADTFQKIEVKK